MQGTSPTITVGGATLTQLAWASAAGCPTALLASHGVDQNTQHVHAVMHDLGVSTRFVVQEPLSVSSFDHVFVQRYAA